MLARDGVFKVRMRLGEGRSRYWSDAEILDDLNTSLKILSSCAQNLNETYQFTTQVIETAGANPAQQGSWQQEYALPVAIDQIIDVKYFAGVLFPLVPILSNEVKVGGHVGGIPWYFYIKPYTRTLSPQINDGSIAVIPLAGELGAEYRTVFGIYPVAQSGIPITIEYIPFHPQLKNPMDPVALPEMFKDTWIAYAIARGREKEGALTDAAYWDAQFEKGKQAYLEWSIDQNQQLTPPSYTNRPYLSPLMRGSTSVIVVSQNPGFVGH